MTPERWAQVKDVFSAALEHDAATRSAYLAERCGDDAELRESIERLLDAHAGGVDFIETSPFPGLPAAVASLGRFSGTVRGSYCLGRWVGSGGMGEVYEGRDVRTEARVAIKVLTDTGADAARRLKREARHGLELDHPNICKVYEVVDDAAAGTFIAMEFVDGVLLSDAVRPGGLDAQTVTNLALQLGEAIGHAHTNGIVHRDLKCGNLMLTPDGRLKVLDFGLARRLPSSMKTAVTAASFTEAGVIAGTLSYLAPEVLKGERPDARSDVWAFGVVLHELITGDQPFEGRTPFELTSAVLREPPAALSSNVSSGLRTIRDTCLAKDPAERYQDGGELLQALQALRSGGRVPRRPKSRSPRRVLSSAAIVAVALVGALIGVLTLGRVSFPPRVRTLAVLPLQGTPDYFADGITEALIARFGTMDSLRVVSRTSSARYDKETSLATVRRDLQADVVVRGVVERVGGQIRLDAELIDGISGARLWNKTFSRDENEVLALENDAVREIVGKLNVPIAASKQTTLRVARAVEPVVYEDYLKGRYYWNKRTPESLQQAVTYYQAAIDRDPTYAPAHAALADCYNQMGTVMVGSASPLDMRPRAKAAAIAAIQADESLAEAHATLGYISHYDWDWAAAEREFRRAIELNPNLALAHTWYANYLVSRRQLSQAIAEVRLAEQLDPFSLVVITNVGWTLGYDRRPDEAIAAYRRALALDPRYVQARSRFASELSVIGRFDESAAEARQVADLSRHNPPSLALLAQIHARAGRRSEAVSLLNQLLNVQRTTYVSPVLIYATYFHLGDRENGFTWVEKALQERSNGTVYMAVDRFFDPFRDDPRYQEAIRRIGLSDAR